FPQDVQELQALLGPLQSGQTIQAVPGTGTNVPLWILGSSLFGAQLAAALGLPYAFASHFAPAALMEALDVYRRSFQPSAQLKKPYAMVGVMGCAADTDEQAQYLFTSMQQGFTNMIRGTRGLLQAPIDDIETYWSLMEKQHVQGMVSKAIVGSPDTVRDRMARLIKETEADELIIAGPIYDHTARLRSFELMAEAAAALGKGH
ncbi:MAG: MsnO8 family LLM class oxidoreductase, partial [Kordiimonadaceae bacterium]|nr:MsnO8 family LLM class oxidoreductase [Kordiimonadaceae bacterium]